MILLPVSRVQLRNSAFVLPGAVRVDAFWNRLRGYCPDTFRHGRCEGASFFGFGACSGSWLGYEKLCRQYMQAVYTYLC